MPKIVQIKQPANKRAKLLVYLTALLILFTYAIGSAYAQESDKTTLSEASHVSPAIAFTTANSGRIYIAWAGTDKRLNVSIYGANYALVDKFTSDQLSIVQPSLVLRTDGLFIGWTGTDDRLNYARVDVKSDHISEFSGKVTLSEKSTVGPTLISDGTTGLYISWTGTDSRLNIAKLSLPE